MGRRAESRREPLQSINSGGSAGGFQAANVGLRDMCQAGQGRYAMWMSLRPCGNLGAILLSVTDCGNRCLYFMLMQPPPVPELLFVFGEN